MLTISLRSAGIVLWLGSVCLAGEVRTWTDLQGKTLRGEFVRVHEGRVVLKRGSQTTMIPLAQFSQSDQDYVQKQVDRTNGGASNGSANTPDEGGNTATPAKKKIDPQDRTWTDLQGNQQTGKFVRVHFPNVVLTQGNRVISVVYLQLSEGDKAYVKELLVSQDQEELVATLDRYEEAAISAAAQEAEERQANGGTPSPASPPGPPPPFSQGPFVPPFNPPPPPSFGSSGSSTLDEMRARNQQIMEEQRQRREQQAEEARQQREQRAEESRQRAEVQRQQEEERRQKFAEANNSIMSQLRASQPAGGTEISYFCSKCNGNVPAEVTAGMNCPHCGAYFEYEETQTGQRKYADPKTAPSKISVNRGVAKLVVWVIILVCGGAAGIWRKFSGSNSDDSRGLYGN